MLSYPPVTGSNFHSSEDLGITGEVVNERAIHSRQVLVFCDLTHCIQTITKSLHKKHIAP